MSWACDTTELIPGSWLSSVYPGHGVLGSAIPSTGGSGPSALYGAVNLPADNAKEIRGYITRWPGGSLQIGDDGVFSYSGVADYFQFALYVDGVASTTDIGYGPGISRITLDTGVGGVFTANLVLSNDLGTSTLGVPLPLSNAELRDMYQLVQDLARIHGLVSAQPLIVTSSTRSAGPIQQTVSQTGDVTTVTRV